LQYPSRVGLPDDRAQIEAGQTAGRASVGKPLPPDRICQGERLLIAAWAPASAATRFC
jgi:hypothetical protein